MRGCFCLFSFFLNANDTCKWRSDKQTEGKSEKKDTNQDKWEFDGEILVKTKKNYRQMKINELDTKRSVFVRIWNDTKGRYRRGKWKEKLTCAYLFVGIRLLSRYRLHTNRYVCICALSHLLCLLIQWCGHRINKK